MLAVAHFCDFDFALVAAGGRLLPEVSLAGWFLVALASSCALASIVLVLGGRDGFGESASFGDGVYR